MSSCHIAYVNLGLGEYEEAIGLLNRAFEERDGLLAYANMSEGYDPLRADPRFQALLRRMNFPETDRRSGSDTDTSPTA